MSLTSLRCLFGRRPLALRPHFINVQNIIKKQSIQSLSARNKKYNHQEVLNLTSWALRISTIALHKTKNILNNLTIYVWMSEVGNFKC